MMESQQALTCNWRVLASETLAAGALVAHDEDGYLVEADDKADFVFAGINQNRVVALATGYTTAGELAEGRVNVQGLLVAYLSKRGTNPDVIGDPVYMYNATNVTDATDATYADNSHLVGKIWRFLATESPADYKNDTYVTSGCYVLVGYDASANYRA